MHLLKYSLFISLILSLLNGHSQNTYTLLGSVSDSNGNRLPFATIFQEGTTNGTTSNAEGNFQLKVQAGTHRISAQYVGFSKVTKEINVNKNQSLDFKLASETLVLQEVIVSSVNKNPAYRIIREAIKKRKYYEKLVNAYSCKVYIKGLQRLDKRPSSILGIAVPLDTGIMYLSESISEVNFEQPNKFNETLIASKTSGKSNGFSYNRASEMMINLYQNSFFIEGLSERPLISPISNNAFISYDYKLDGVIYQDSIIINKIKLIPRRKTDPTFSGYIYIIENSWNFHSVDVSLTQDNGIEFVDSIRINQIFSPAQFDIWMPISQNFSYTFGAFGFNGSGRFTGNYSEYQLEPDYTLFVPKKDKEIVQTEIVTKIDLFTKKDFGNAILKVDEKANQKDDIFWKSVRPVPLSKIEVADYKIKDSIQLITETKVYKDSADFTRNKFRIANLFFGGYTNYNSYKETRLRFPTSFDLIQYNTVEGFAPELKFTYAKSDQRIPLWEVKPSLKYGFANNELQGSMTGFKTINYKKWEFLYAGAGRYTTQYNDKNPISTPANTYITLIQGRNYLKSYQKAYAFLGYQKEIFENIRLNAKLEFASRNHISNATTYSFANDPTMTDNLSVHDFGDNNRISKLELQLTLRPGLKYIDRPKTKFYLTSKYPEFKIKYTKGIPLYGENNFDELSLLATYNFRIGVFGSSNISVETGAFLSKETLTFIEHKHFNGNQTIFRNNIGNTSFQLLPYYAFSTNNAYFESHFEHHFNEFIFNKIPLVKKFNLQAVVSANFLSTIDLSNYTEIGFGVEHIFRFLRVDFYTSFNEGKHLNHGIVFGLGF